MNLIVVLGVFLVERTPFWKNVTYVLVTLLNIGFLPSTVSISTIDASGEVLRNFWLPGIKFDIVVSFPGTRSIREDYKYKTELL